MRERGLVTFCFVVVFVAGGLLAPPVTGQDSEIRKDIEKVVGDARKALQAELGRMLEVGEDELVREIELRVEQRTKQRIAELEAALRTRDDKIAELESKLANLTGKTTPPKESPKAPPALLGVAHIDLPAEAATELKVGGGALVTQVMAGSPADQAGLQAGDVLVELNGKKVTSADLQDAVASCAPGKEVTITYFRDGKTAQAVAKLVDREKFLAGNRERVEPPAPPRERDPVVLGIRIAETEEGILVDEVEEGFTGSVAGLQKGDRITKIAGNDVRVIDEVVDQLAKLKEGDEFSIDYIRGNETVAVTVVGAAGEKGARFVSAKKAAMAPPKEVEPSAPEPPPARDGKPGFLGVVVSDGAEKKGAVVEQIVDGSSAAKAGLEKGDVLLKVKGKEVAGVAGLRAILGDLREGDTVAILIDRNGKRQRVDGIQLGAFDGTPIVVAPVVKPEPPKVEPPKPEAEPEKPRPPGRLGINASQSQDNVVRVKTVFSGSPAEKAGLKEGDVLLRVNDKEILSLDDIATALEGMVAGDTLRLKVRRGDQEQDLEVQLGEPYAFDDLES